MMKRLFLTLCALCATTVLWADTATVDGITWTYTVSDGKATITPSGSWEPTIPAETSGTVTIPSRLDGYLVREIADNAFFMCRNLEKVIIPNGITKIGMSAFYDCTNLTSVEIPGSVVEIGGSAFSWCTSLTFVKLPSAVEFGPQAFSACPLVKFEVAEGNPFYVSQDGAIFNTDKTTLVYMPGNLTSYEIPATVKTIGPGACYGRTTLTSVTIPEGVTSIESYAFHDCSGLTSVTIPEGVTSIGEDTFSGCTSLTSVTIPSNVSSIGYGAFDGCSGLTSVTIPSSVTSIGSSAFSGCSGLTSITIPSSVTSIGRSAFSHCSRLTSITIPEGVTVIGDSAFSHCSKLKIKVNAQNVNYASQDGALFNKNMTTLLRGPGATEEYAIPESVTSIGDDAFSGLTDLKKVTFPSKVGDIGWNAFSNCSQLKIVVEAGNLTYASQDGALFNKNMTTLVRGPGATAEYTIPKSVTSIGENAFYGCAELVEIEIPTSVSSIGDQAFCECTGLRSIKIPEGIAEIPYCAFYDCPNLASIEMPESVTSIGSSAFSGCTGLTSVTIPDGVTSIVDFAFLDCSGLTSVTFLGTPPSVGYSAFPATNGYYTSEYATAWETVIDEDGKWNNLKMRCLDEASSYMVSLETIGEGSVTGADEYAEGDNVTLTATAEEGWVFCGWNTDPVTPSEFYTFTMPAEDVTLTAYFAPEKAIQQYIATNGLISPEQIGEIAMKPPVIGVEDGKTKLSLKLMKATTLTGNTWADVVLKDSDSAVVTGGQLSIELVPEADEKTAFYKFVVPPDQSK